VICKRRKGGRRQIERAQEEGGGKGDPHASRVYARGRGRGGGGKG